MRNIEVCSTTYLKLSYDKNNKNPKSRCHILSEYGVPVFSNMMFSIVIHLTIYSHEHNVRDHHRIETQTVHREWIITFQANREKRDNK